MNSSPAHAVVDNVVTVGGLPAHPLIVHAIVVLFPLAALGTLAVAARPVWRRTLGIPVFLVALVGLVAVPLAVLTGEQLKNALGGGGPLVAIHEQRALRLLPFAVAFVVLLLATVVLGRRADRARYGPPSRLGTVTAAVGVLAALAGIVVFGLVVWIGEAGSAAVWHGVLG